MARQLSGDEQNKKIGIVSFSEDKTSLVVIGKVGINTEDAMDALHVEGNAFVSGSIGIGTTNPDSAVMPSNNTIINVGIVTARKIYGTDVSVANSITANEIYGEIKGATGVVTSADNINGGADGKLLIQAGPGITSFFEYGSTNQALVSRGDGTPPHWAAAAPAGAIEGLLLFEDGSIVGGGNSYGGLDFRGSAITVVGAGTPASIGTITVSGNFGDEFITGAGISVAGVGTFSGGIQAAGIVTAIPGFGLTYYGDGSNLTGVSGGGAGGLWAQNSVGIDTTSNVGIKTTEPVSDLQVGSATSSFNVVTDSTTVSVGIGTTSPNFTLDVRGDANIGGDLTVEGSQVGTIAMILALGGL